ncbi:MAG: transglutaminase-like domain-containing protein [Chloroflexota bacterium]|nr:MAG: hypothetical protein DIU80_02625 [Chloroflexota bacterium]
MDAALTARARFRGLIRRPEPQLALAEAALCIAWEDQGACDIPSALALLDAFAAEIRPRLARCSGAPEIAAAVNGHLFGELGFRGNSVDYGDPANSYLDRVLERRTGLPITLSVVYLEVGWRLGLPVAGLALPGRFLVQYRSDDGPLYIDPFGGGELWSYADCARQVTAFYGAAPPALMREVLRPPSKAAILLRMLRNLKAAYVEREDLPRALAAVERILLLAPDEHIQRRDRGLLRARLGKTIAALEDLERYARSEPKAPDLPAIRHQARALLGSVRDN